MIAHMAKAKRSQSRFIVIAVVLHRLIIYKSTLSSF